jgi:WD40 repeat protein
MLVLPQSDRGNRLLQYDGEDDEERPFHFHLLTTSKDNTLRLWDLQTESTTNTATNSSMKEKKKTTPTYCRILNPSLEENKDHSMLQQDNDIDLAFTLSANRVLYRSDHDLQVWNLETQIQEFCLPFKVHHILDDFDILNDDEKCVTSSNPDLDEQLLKFHDIQVLPLSSSDSSSSIKVLIRSEDDRYSIWRYEIPDEKTYRKAMLPLVESSTAAPVPRQWDLMKKIVEEAIAMKFIDALIVVS